MRTGTISLDDARRCSPTFYPASFVRSGDVTLWLERRDQGKSLLLAAADGPTLSGFEGETVPTREGMVAKRLPVSPANAARLRQLLPNLQPVPLGTVTSAGFGDRLGIATPGHAMALRRVLDGDHEADLSPVFAQQSIREMTRTGRTPQEVVDDATWGAFEAGWRGTVGADADHLKSPVDIDSCLAAGFSFFTIDPGDHVDDEAHDAPAPVIERKVEALPWHMLEGSPGELEIRYVGRRVDLGEREFTLELESVLRAAAKYGRAVAHVAMMYRHLSGKGVPFELEVSVDETERPTSHAEHVYIASELRRLGVTWVSLAPRYVGRFEKGVDYLGDLKELATDLAGHAAIARALGPYKLSLHSGSDKFSVYPLISQATKGMTHLKTAGTSYLEALRVVAAAEPEQFRRIWRFACERFEEDRHSYHISASLERLPASSRLGDEDLADLLDQDDARQILHVTFGSVLTDFRPQIMSILTAREEEHYQGLARHFERHLEPFVEVAS